MPLPAALLARLQKRGIIRLEPEPEPTPEPELEFENDPDEEVIAEDYDDPAKKTEVNDDKITEYDIINGENKENIVHGCPNKWNIYHECSPFCREYWKDGIHQPSPSTERKRLKMLKKYPVPEGWQEIYDPGTGRYYYWNVNSDEVSWLPPAHPRAVISPPAEKLRVLIKETFIDEGDDENIDEKSESESDEEMEDDDDKMDEDDDDIDQRVVRHKPELEIGRGKGKLKGNDLDPMDPAAYSEVPRGTWSTGLARKGEAKTGADATASGPLYQMRPYPSPGAVLRMNAELKPKDLQKLKK